MRTFCVGYAILFGNLGQDYQDIDLYYFRSNGKSYYRVDAKSGEYNIQFYVKGTYKKYLRIVSQAIVRADSKLKDKRIV